MELQAAASVVLDAAPVISTVDVPTLVLKDVRAEAAARITLTAPQPEAVRDEFIVPDQRAELSPAQAVERKLSAMLRGDAAIAVSHFRLAKLCRKP
jgi:hypothetical protein